MALVKRLKELSTVSSSRLHLDLLQTYADHGTGATLAVSLDFLQQLRKARDAVGEKTKLKTPARVRQRLQAWSEECVNHDGFSRLREQVLHADAFKHMADSDLSRAYNSLLRLGFGREAEVVWPSLVSRLSNGTMRDPRALLGLWSVAPANRLLEIDDPLAKVFGEGDIKTWQLLSAISRAADQPRAQVTIYCAHELKRRLHALSSEDLALVAFQVGARLATQQGLDPSLQELVQGAKLELLSRDGVLEAQQLRGLLGALQGRSDALWPSVRAQLLTYAQKKESKISPQAAIEVMSFIRRHGGRESEPELFRGAASQLKKALNANAEPGLVAMVSYNLEDIIEDFGTTQVLLNVAVRLRKDLYPAVLWTLFVRCAEVGLVKKHPGLLVRLQRIGEVLEDHGIKRHKMALRDMPSMVNAMRENGVTLHKSLGQMAKYFSDVHDEVLKGKAGGGTSANYSQGVDAISDSTEPELRIPKSKQKPSLTSRADLGETNWLAEVQQLMIEFWVQLNIIGVEEHGLGDTLKSFCQPNGECAIPQHLLAHCLSKLNLVLESVAKGIASDTAQALADGLAMQLAENLAQLTQRQLVEVAQLASTPAGGSSAGVLWSKVFGEVDRRLSQGGRTRLSILRRSEDFDDVVAMLGAVRPMFQQRSLTSNSDINSVDIVVEASELSHKIGQLMIESLPNLLVREPEKSLNRLSVFTGHLSTFDAATRETALFSARSWLHKAKLSNETTPCARGSFLLSSELAFNFTTLSGGHLSLDLVGRLNRVLGDALGALPYTSTTGGTSNRMEEAASLLSQRQAAQLWAFFLASRHLLSCSTSRTLLLAPEAPIIEALLEQFKRKDRAVRLAPCFDLHDEAVAKDMVSLLQKTVAKASAVTPKGGKLCEERFEIPGTPYMVDFAWPAQRRLIIVPRTEHFSTQVGDDGVPYLNASAMLAQRLLESLNWKVCWAWTHIWATRCEEGTPGEVVAEMFASKNEGPSE